MVVRDKIERQFGASSHKPGPSPDSPIRAPWHLNFSIWVTVWVVLITLDVNSESLQLSRHTSAPISACSESLRSFSVLGGLLELLS